MSQDLRSRLADVSVEGEPCSDNLAIVICTYFERHLERPEDDPESDYGWGEWTLRKTDEALDRIVAAIEDAAR